MGDVSEIMIALTSSDGNVRVPAEQMVQSARESDLPGFLVALVKELRDETKPDSSRQMAGIVLKNSVAFNAREVERKQELEARWRTIDAETRNYVKSEMFASLDSNELVRLIVALVIANLARIELPAGEWPDLIPNLCGAVSQGQPVWMETALTTLGYICEECETNEQLTGALAEQSGPILNAIFQGMHSETTSVKYHATKSLCNAIDFIGKHMENPEQRASLIEAICGSASCNDANTRSKALETLAVVGRMYYEHLNDHIETLWNVTTNAVRNDVEECALQGLLFWLAICEVENDMEDMPTNNHYTNAILDQLFNLIAECLVRQEEGQSEDDWNVSTAASKVLVALADAVQDAITPIAMPFVNDNFSNENWRFREAAVLAFGCILSGPDPANMKQVVSEALPAVCGYVTGDSDYMVRDSSLWTLSIICTEYAPLVLAEDILPHVLDAVGPTLQMDSNLTCRGAAVIHNLCLHYDELGAEDDEAQENELTPYYSGIVQGLLGVLDRSDVDDHMRHDTQEALNRLFGAAAPASYQVLVELIPNLLQRLEVTTNMAKEQGLTAELELSQGLLVGAINHICRKVKRNVTPCLDQIVAGLTTMFACSRDGSVLVEAIMCIGALGLATREAFEQYLEQFHPYVQAALTSVDEYDLCASAIATLGDLASALDARIAPMLPETMNNFVEHLRNPEGDRDLKPPMIHCLGDVVLNCGGAAFAPYLDTFMTVVQELDQAARALQADFHQQEDEDFVAELWEAMLSMGTGVLQGYSEDPTPILNYLDYFLDLLLSAPQALQNDEDILKASISLAGDMANVMRHGPPQYHQPAKAKLCTPQVQNLLGTGTSWEDEDVQEAARWSMRELNRLSNM